MREYGVRHFRYPDELWRGPYETRQEVDDWISEWLEDGGKPGVFEPVVREVSPWTPVDSKD